MPQKKESSPSAYAFISKIAREIRSNLNINPIQKWDIDDNLSNVVLCMRGLTSRSAAFYRLLEGDDIIIHAIADKHPIFVSLKNEDKITRGIQLWIENRKLLRKEGEKEYLESAEKKLFSKNELSS